MKPLTQAQKEKLKDPKYAIALRAVKPIQKKPAQKKAPRVRRK